MTTTTKIAGEAMQITDEQIDKLIREYRLDGTDSVAMFNFARALLESKPAVPEGWKLVPVEPSEEMIQAACLKQSNTAFHTYYQWLDSHSSGVSARIRQLVAGDYRAMLAASPTAPAQSCGDAEQADAPQAVTTDDMEKAVRNSKWGKDIQSRNAFREGWKTALTALPRASEQADEAVTK